MTSGYARPEPPGAAWAYNDFAIQLYQKTLFERVWQEDAAVVAAAPNRLGTLQFEDGLSFDSRRRLFASVRDFARIAWFWLHRGRWRDRQVLQGDFFRQYQKSDVPFSLPHTREAGDDDYLGIGTFGGGSDHFTKFGPGVYGFNWWFNRTSRLHPDRTTWPDAPADTILSIGAGGNCSAMFPSRGVVLASARGRWGQLTGGDPESPMNRHLRLLAEATGGPRRKCRSNPAAISSSARAARCASPSLMASVIRRCFSTSATRSMAAALPALLASSLRARPEANNDPIAVSSALAAYGFPEVSHSLR
jgi:hypothetical protein